MIGYKCTLESDSYLTWQDPVCYTFSNFSPNFVVPVDTDYDEYTYPKVTITTGGTGGDIAIINQTDSASRLTAFKGLSPNISFIMNGDINWITGDNYTKFAQKNFIRLLDGENTFTIQGDIASLKFEWNNRRFM